MLGRLSDLESEIEAMERERTRNENRYIEPLEQVAQYDI
ncbi:hypothetical protein B0G84_8551 [Paraburkholderia sp. BL8N3]|nr:hypothetical protein B0G84_8551 [Paraburkholderia sp. BL8N3]